jgi:hypothetical protein
MGRCWTNYANYLVIVRAWLPGVDVIILIYNCDRFFYFGSILNEIN